MSRSLPVGRLTLLSVVLAVLAGPVQAQRRGDCRAAEATGWRGTMASQDEPGERLRVRGRVLDEAGEPVAGVTILAYQTDAEGYYSKGGRNESDARLCAVVETNDRGEYALETIRPGAYPTGGVPAHIHFELWSDAIRRQRRDLQFADDPLVADSRKPAASRASTVRPVTRDAAGVWVVERDLRISR